MLDCADKPLACIKNVLLSYLPILQYDATLLGTKNKCQSIGDVLRFKLRYFLFFKSIY